MENKSRLILHFTTTSALKKSFYIDYPKLPAVPADVKALADFIKLNQMFNYTDGSQIASFDGAVIEEVTTSDVNFAI